ncbi:MAG TPA: ABC transporter substrate binding protein, partial [Leptospiraceae bacterium]|nr:ABC transporter substrate binding protein [Leptospiraceae bacterium]
QAGTIPVILSSESTIYESVLSGIGSAMNRRLTVQYLDAIIARYPDPAAYFQALEAQKPELVITIGSAASTLARDNLKQTPIVFSMVNTPRLLGVGSRNICGVGMGISIGEFFRSIRDIAPTARFVHAFYTTDAGETEAMEGDYLDYQNKLVFVRHRLSGPAELGSALEKIKGHSDAILIVNDPLYSRTAFEKVSSFSSQNHMILAAPFPALVKLGTTFGISPDYSKIGVQTGEMALRVLSGKSTCYAELVQPPEHNAFYLNEDYAAKSGIAIPPKIVARAKLTQQFALGVDLLNQGKLKSARLVFENILKADPSNNAASSFLQVALERQSGTRVTELLAQADRYMAEKQFALAVSEYRRVLSINPNVPQARLGLDQSLQGQSDQERERAQALEAQGRPFDAIRTYMQALQTLPGNQNAIQGLAALRARQAPQMQELVRHGVQAYDARDYGEAISIFDNVLLVIPGQKEATEYLRLAQKKRAALNILQTKDAEVRQ